MEGTSEGPYEEMKYADSQNNEQEKYNEFEESHRSMTTNSKDMSVAHDMEGEGAEGEGEGEQAERKWFWAFPQIEGVPPSPRGGHSATLIGASILFFGGHFYSDHEQS